MRRALAAAAFASLLAACTAPDASGLYRWGGYEDSAAIVMRDSAAQHLSDEIRRISGDIEKAQVEGRRVPPGLHAHLGYLYDLSGNPESAALEFEQEKALYPESAKFMDGLLRRMHK